MPPPAHAAALPPARETTDDVTVLAGVPYAAPPGIRPLELDLWLPPASAGGPFPVVVFLHGGGWRVGSRRSMGPAFDAATLSPFEQVARSGIAVASIDYRLSGEATWPTQLHDAKAAVRWLRHRADELGIDPGRIAAWGESAGGHLAELLGLTGDDPALEGDVGIVGPSSAVGAVAAWYAPSDLRAVAADLGVDPMDPETREALLLGAPPPVVPDLAAQASPISYVPAPTAPTGPAESRGAADPAAPVVRVPFLLLHGRVDRMIPCAQSERLQMALTSAGFTAQLHLYEDANHMWLGAPAAAIDALDRTIAFLGEQWPAAPTDQHPTSSHPTSSHPISSHPTGSHLTSGDATDIGETP